MPRIDGYPAADPLTGSEVLPGMQGGATKSISLDQLADWVQTTLRPVFAQKIAGSIVPPGDGAAADIGLFLADDIGLFLGFLGLEI